MKTLAYLIGPPGAGKTTALRLALGDYTRTPASIAGCPTVTLESPTGPVDGLPGTITELGRDREGDFAGTDALSMSIQPKATAAMATLDGLVVAEGDRLANARFWQTCEDLGWTIRVLYLNTPLAECARRRAGRGGAQNPTWVQGRITKTRHLAEAWGAIAIDGTTDPVTTAIHLRATLATLTRPPPPRPSAL